MLRAEALTVLDGPGMTKIAKVGNLAQRQGFDSRTMTNSKDQIFGENSQPIDRAFEGE